MLCLTITDGWNISVYAMCCCLKVSAYLLIKLIHKEAYTSCIHLNGPSFNAIIKVGYFESTVIIQHRPTCPANDGV